MPAQNVRKGRFILRRSRRIIPFMFNPNSIKGRHGWDYGRSTPPGRSHPYYGGGQGAEETITFQLYLDGDRGRSDFRSNDPDLVIENEPDFNIMPQVNELRSLTRPDDPDLDGAYGIPDSIFCSMGTILRGEVRAISIDWEIINFTKEYDAKRAYVDCELVIIERDNNTNWLFLNAETSDALTENPPLFGGGDIP